MVFMSYSYFYVIYTYTCITFRVRSVILVYKKHLPFLQPLQYVSEISAEYKKKVSLIN